MYTWNRAYANELIFIENNEFFGLCVFINCRFVGLADATMTIWNCETFDSVQEAKACGYMP